MSRWLAMLFAVVLTLVAVGAVLTLCWLATEARAQIVAPAPCEQILACLQQRVRDLKDYREFADDQLALAKALNQALESKVRQQTEALKACQEKVPNELPPRGSDK